MENYTNLLFFGIITLLSLLSLSFYMIVRLRSKSNKLLADKNRSLVTERDEANKKALEAKLKLKKYTFIKIDSHFKTAINQYLAFFSNYIEDSKKVKIRMNVKDAEDGIYISFDVPENLDKVLFQNWFNEYLNHLNYKKSTDEININTVKGVSKEETDLLILKLKSQINHYQRQLDILKIENVLLKNNSEFFKDTLKLLSSKSQQIFISNTNNEIDKQNNYSDQSQFIGSTFSNSEIKISNVDEKIINLIKNSTLEKKKQNELIDSIQTLKDDSISEKQKKKSGNLLRKFLETTVSESAKEVIRFAAENTETWLRHISNI